MIRKWTKCTPVAAVLLVGCGDYSGQREPPPPPPAIVAGTYASAATDGVERWSIDLPSGGRTTAASVTRCREQCAPAATLPVRQGLNGLSLSVPTSAVGPAVDLAIMPDGAGISIVYAEGEALVERVLVRRDPLTPRRP